MKKWSDTIKEIDTPLIILSSSREMTRSKIRLSICACYCTYSQRISQLLYTEYTQAI